ncbi:hypothetical protein [Stenotrophomonas humi]
MKEPITNRDLFVISILCTGFGTLLAWGLFYRWGSAPDIKPFDLPAWVQAIGSITAICVAIYVPWRQRSQQMTDARCAEERRVQREREVIRIMHAAMFQPVESFRTTCIQIQKNIRTPLADRKYLPEDVFDRPVEFNQFRNELHLMGETGHKINVLISQQDYLRMMLRALRAAEDPLGRDFVDRAERGLTKGREYAEEILAVLPRIARGEVG